MGSLLLFPIFYVLCYYLAAAALVLELLSPKRTVKPSACAMASAESRLP